MEKDVQNSQALLRDSELKRAKLHDDIQESSHQMHEQAAKSKIFQDQIINENRALAGEIQRLKQVIEQMEGERIQVIASFHKEKAELHQRQQAQLAERDFKIKELLQFNLQLEANIKQQGDINKMNADISDQLLNQIELNRQQEEQKKVLQRELLVSADYIGKLEEKVYSANKTSLELLNELKEAEDEMEGLRNYIVELKGKMSVYIPAKDDQIDLKLAEFINNYPERQRLKILFLRESEGVYQFGSRRVAVRVDKDKINIRVGGGYLQIDEFLDQYTPQELEKQDRKDPLKRFSEKIVVQKTLVGKEIKESSPIRNSLLGSQYLSQPSNRSNGSPSKY
ncbi:hypothetical protein FGO68_gene7539 [Halteria grandinella]|uniref:GAR domain-containing protein n=1 Tax=Halteria grandinella TaxID=5974 RepID=A0A8J8NQT0_HALGN|nr:hypothetical protein FGO68_gene7539 [Halteria grandinella]